MVIGWNLLSSAASFPMVFRYSSAAINQMRDDYREVNTGVTEGEDLGKRLWNGY